MKEDEPILSNDILPENNEGMRLVPQILTNDAKGFLQTVEKLEDYGYEEVNLNLGCPSKTVVSKNRRSGFLAMPDELDRFLDEIYRGTQVRISIKTRIGKHSPDEFERLLKIYNQYPVEELIIHPRLQQDFYKNTPNLEVFAEAVRESRNPCESRPGRRTGGRRAGGLETDSKVPRSDL